MQILVLYLPTDPPSQTQTHTLLSIERSIIYACMCMHAVYPQYSLYILEKRDLICFKCHRTTQVFLG